MTAQNIIFKSVEIEIDGVKYEALPFGVFIMAKVQEYLAKKQNEATIVAAKAMGIEFKDVLNELNKPIPENKVVEHLQEMDVIMQVIYHGIKRFNPDFDFDELSKLEPTKIGEIAEKLLPVSRTKKKKQVTTRNGSRKRTGSK